ncbi:MAG: enoyl-CoA hydratase/isomerase family protein, partial [Caldilineae bacterium]
MSVRYIRTERKGDVGVVTLDRPQRHNALVPEMLEELLAAWGGMAESDARVLVLRANGRSFSTGGDVRGFYEHREEIEVYARKIVGLLNEVMLTMMSLPQPIIAAVHGMVTGGALGLVLASDVVLVTPRASFTPYYGVVGFSPDGGWTALLPQIIGVQRTARILFENSTIGAEEAVAWGLAAEVVEEEALEQRVNELAGSLLALRTGSSRRSKRLLRGDLAGVAARLEEERRQFVEQILTREAAEGMAAFLR